MGVQLTELISVQALELDDLLGKRIAVDALNWIYQFLSSIRQPDGTPLMDSKRRVTSHLSGLFYRNLKLMQAGVKLIYVFDGKKPEFKAETTKKRMDAREEARKAWTEALEKGNYEEARKQAMRSTQITGEIIEGSKRLLEIMGIPVLTAMQEGEALCAQLVKDGNAYAAASQDFDTLLFGCPTLIRNLSLSGKKKQAGGYITVKPEKILLKDMLDQLKISRDQLIVLGMLVGTDFNPGGIKGIGPKKGLELVKKKKTLKAVLKEVEWNFDVDPKLLFDFFKNPEPTEYEVEFNSIDKEKLKHMLCDEHDFSEERIDSALKKLEETPKQQSLAGWLKK